MRHTTLVAALGAAVALPLGAAAQDKAPGAASGSTVRTTSPDYTASMLRLQEAAQRLREAIQAMAQQPPGEGRNKAIDQAHQALYDTQSAMIQLPPELRTGPGSASQPNYTRSMERLQQAAQKLLETQQAMVMLPPDLRTAGTQR